MGLARSRLLSLSYMSAGHIGVDVAVAVGVAVPDSGMMFTLALALPFTAVSVLSKPVATTTSVSTYPSAPSTVAVKAHWYEPPG
jgi:hypothetical protein